MGALAQGARYAPVSMLLLLVSAAAGWIPARRATRVDPLAAAERVMRQSPRALLRQE